VARVVKGVAMAVLISVSVVALWYGIVYLLFGRPLMRVLGLVLLVGGFRAIIWSFDMMWGRPPAFSKEPWNRPWEDDARRPPGA
jgi:hypothetical protein